MSNSSDYRDMPEWTALQSAVDNFLTAKEKRDGDGDGPMLLQEFAVVACRVPLNSDAADYEAMNYCYASSKIGHHVTGLLRDALDYCTERD